MSYDICTWIILLDISRCTEKHFKQIQNTSNSFIKSWIKLKWQSFRTRKKPFYLLEISSHTFLLFSDWTAASMISQRYISIYAMGIGQSLSLAWFVSINQILVKKTENSWSVWWKSAEIRNANCQIYFIEFILFQQLRTKISVNFWNRKCALIYYGFIIMP